MSDKKKKKTLQSKVYEFIPVKDINIEEIEELSTLVRIGVGGHIIDMASDGLKRHFTEIKDSKK